MGSQQASLQKASNGWKSRCETMALMDNNLRKKTFCSTFHNGLRHAFLKAVPGRGRHRTPFVSALYVDILSEFERLSSAGLKFSPAILQHVAIHLMTNADVSSEYHISKTNRGGPIKTNVTIKWVQYFMVWRSIDSRAQTGKLMTSPGKTLLIENEVAFHHGQLKRDFEFKDFSEDTM